VGFALYGFAPTGLFYICVMPVFALINFLQPGLQGLMTRRVGPSEQGQLQGASQSLQGIAAIVGPMVFGSTFAWAVDHNATLHMPGLPIFLASAALIAASLIALRVAATPPVRSVKP
jgi:DHA1 family tetracycline resistance protein-like MFS transporter